MRTNNLVPCCTLLLALMGLAGQPAGAVWAAANAVSTPSAATPTFSPAGGLYGAPQHVTISDTTKGATIYYTTNGKTPTTASAKYTAPLTVGNDETLKAIAVAPAHAESAVASATYRFKLTAAQINSILAGAQTYYASLPHLNLASDLKAVAGNVLASGEFASAAVSPEGESISGALSDGTPAVLFATEVEYLQGSAPRSTPAAAAAAALSPATGHEIAFLVNESGDNAFTPATQQAFADAFTNIGFASPAFGVDTLDVSLDNIVALGASHDIDYLDIATHGVVRFDAKDNPYYGWLSTTPINAANDALYAGDLATQALVHGGTLTIGTKSVQVYVFTPQFLTKHLTFNPGAIVVNMSCNGQRREIGAAVGATFGAAGVGTYLGWNKPVTAEGADQTDGFLLDRLLGEQSPSVTNLTSYAPQLSPPQRPFPFTQILARMAIEARDPMLLDPTTSIPYTQDYSSRFYTPSASLVVTTFATSTQADAPIEYTMPTISTLQVVESATGGALTINGSFPSASGTVQITDRTGTHPLKTSGWTTSAITATLPPGGPGASGLVQVTSADGVPSNQVPLTQWSAALTYQEDDTITSLSGQAGSGAGTISATFNVNFRADVHPVAVDIDMPAKPQNLTFSGPMGGSTASVTGFSGKFDTSDGKASATFSLGRAVPAMTPYYTVPLASGTFDVGAVAGQPATCNDGIAGPESGPNATFCPGVGLRSVDVGVCTDTDGTLCPRLDYSLYGSYSYPPGSATGSLLIFTMDPKTYAITVSAVPSTYSADHFGGPGETTASMSGTVDAPLSPPTPTTPAVLRRADGP